MREDLRELAQSDRRVDFAHCPRTRHPQSAAPLPENGAARVHPCAEWASGVHTISAASSSAAVLREASVLSMRGVSLSVTSHAILVSLGAGGLRQLWLGLPSGRKRPQAPCGSRTDDAACSARGRGLFARRCGYQQRSAALPRACSPSCRRAEASAAACLRHKRSGAALSRGSEATRERNAPRRCRGSLRHLTATFRRAELRGASRTVVAVVRPDAGLGAHICSNAD